MEEMKKEKEELETELEESDEPTAETEAEETDGALAEETNEGQEKEGEPKKGLFNKKKEKKKDKKDEQIEDLTDRLKRQMAEFENFRKRPEEQKEDPFVDGMNKIYKQMMTMLEEAGVKPIEAVGAEFDPEYHNAVMHIEDDSLGENIIAEELLKGYMYHDAVVRHSMVKVAN